MWTLLFLLFAMPVPDQAPEASQWGERASNTIQVSTLAYDAGGQHVADDGAEWASDSRSDPRVRRRRAKRLNRRVQRRPTIRTLRPRRVEEQREVASEVSVQIHRASGVARRVARTIRRSHLPAKIGSADAGRPAT